MHAKMSAKKRSLIDVTFKTSVNEHFELLMNEKSFIENTDDKLTINDLPKWYDENLFKKGQEFYNRNLLSGGLGSFVGLITVLAIPSTLDVLISTKRSNTPCTAFKRYAQTLLHIYILYKYDINDPAGRWWKSLNTIRRKHAMANRMGSNASAGNISQRDMGLTQFGFIGYAMIAPEKLGLKFEPGEMEGFNHLWRVIGYLIGISDKINICRTNATETMELCQRISNEVVVDLIKNQTEICKKMISTLIDAFTCVDIALNTDSILCFWYELNNLKYDKPLGLLTQFNIIYRNSIIYLLGTPIIGSLVRIGFNYYLSVSYWLLEQWPILAYIRFGKNQSKLNLYHHEN